MLPFSMNSAYYPNGFCLERKADVFACLINLTFLTDLYSKDEPNKMILILFHPTFIEMQIG